MSVHTVDTADTLAGSLMAPPFGFGMQKKYKRPGELQMEVSSKLLLGRKASGELEITKNNSPKGKTGPAFNENEEKMKKMNPIKINVKILMKKKLLNVNAIIALALSLLRVM